MFMDMKKGKAPPDGITAEILHNMPDKLVNQLYEFLRAHDDNPLKPLPEELRESEATLTPEKARPSRMKDLRPIAGLHAMKTNSGVYMRQLYWGSARFRQVLYKVGRQVKARGRSYMHSIGKRMG